MSELKFETAGVLGVGMVSALFATVRVRRHGDAAYRQVRAEGRPVIFVSWHSQLLPLLHYHRHEHLVALVSEHADGEYLTRVIERHGVDTVRGSSTRGATKGLKGLIRAARNGRNLALTPDGPRGPLHEFKPGALAVAQATGLPIQALGAAATRAWRFRSWDSFMVPQPLSVVHVAYGVPREVPRDASRAELESMARAFGDELNELTRVAEGAAR
jgi:hypothetical protein